MRVVVAITYPGPPSAVCVVKACHHHKKNNVLGGGVAKNIGSEREEGYL